MIFDNLYVYDIETYKEAFTFSIVRVDGKHKKTFVCSAFDNQINEVFKCLDYLHEKDFSLVGFNNIGFDYPVLHALIKSRNSLPKTGKGIAAFVWRKAQEQIDSFKDNSFGNTVKVQEQYVKQVDLYRIWHFNNKAKSTSLKMLEFNMRMQNIEDLPFSIEAELGPEDVEKIVSYNEHDVEATRQFLLASKEQIEFRFGLNEKLGRDFTNADDTKIGAQFFELKLEESGIQLYESKNGQRKPRQTHRKYIRVKDCLFDYYSFSRPEFQAVCDWFSKQTIEETKGVFSDIEEHRLGELSKYAELDVKKKKFKGKPSEQDVLDFKKEHPMGWIEEEELKATEYALDENGEFILEHPLLDDGSVDLSKKPKKKRIPKKSYWGCWKVASTLNTVVDGYRIDFGVGGVHASLAEKRVKETKKYLIRDADVSSMYPNIAISNRVYPEHLGRKFCDIYNDMYEQRKSFAKGTAENAMLKLALNGTYGKSNDKFSVFYDPKFTMTITINGQLSLLMLADRLLQIDGLKLIQLNTDGLTVALPRDCEDEYNDICKQWEIDVGLQLEFVDYSRMFIRDVNNYIAVYTNGKTKRKGAYQYEGLGWHQNQSALVIPMAAEANMLHGTEVRAFIEKHFEEGNVFDFMLRTKVDRSSRLVLVTEDGQDIEQQRICRYYPAKNGHKLVKIMKPLEGKEEDRRLGIEAAWNIKTCNNMKDFDPDIEFDYYVQEAQKLILV
jgi:hypothetical protein